MTTYVLAGELAVNRVLDGSLPKPAFPEPLRRSAPPNWYGSAAFSLRVADKALRSHDAPVALGLVVKALIALAQAILAERGEWALNEKRILERAGLEHLGDRLLGLRDEAAIATLIGDARAAVP